MLCTEFGTGDFFFGTGDASALAAWTVVRAYDEGSASEEEEEGEEE